MVTGGSKGIGRALVLRFARAGYAVATCARSAPELAVLATTVAHQVPGAVVHTLAADLGDFAGCAEFAAFVLAQKGTLAAVVHNTGAFLPGRLQDEPADGSQLRQLLAVNLLSAYDLTRALLPTLLRQGSGHVFTICSTASVTAYPTGGSYGIAKHALYGFTRNLREELKDQGIRVTAVLPGATLTASWAGVDLPTERFIRPADVAEAVFGAFSLSPQAVVEELLIRPQLGDI
ncbi:SDR family oxidoreductase [Hymenobacter caeli]|uniref:NAD(P)-dependent dehydrogenase (Short-subunit alcohol dehydrogenase family) n=1 Tax=Hymenobacter caeli TaxID=2735894 RepID=A0ABX2FLC8_9BACT|nr:SDR family oxidoreductase [Hymenobacter caeli]NRT17643.1 NAD(P)-dependent dehydrogenase (short-subunit alcohol dehydrogenase family) [Hymenobacter caeli]